MSRGPLTFKQRDLERAIRAARAAGLTTFRVAIGDVVVTVGDVGMDKPKDDSVGSWDKAIAELESRR